MKKWIVYSASWGRTFVEGHFDSESKALEFEDQLAAKYGGPGFLVWTEEQSGAVETLTGLLTGENQE